MMLLNWCCSLNVEKSVGGDVKVYNFVIFHQNHISLGS